VPTPDEPPQHVFDLLEEIRRPEIAEAMKKVLLEDKPKAKNGS